MNALPSFLMNLLAAPPSTGGGVHNWLFKTARHLHAHMPAPKIVALLDSRVQQCGRLVTRREIQEAVRDSMACAWQHQGGGRAQAVAAPKWPTLDEEHRAAITCEGAGVADLWEFSNPRVKVGRQNRFQPHQVINALMAETSRKK